MRLLIAAVAIVAVAQIAHAQGISAYDRGFNAGYNEGGYPSDPTSSYSRGYWSGRDAADDEYRMQQRALDDRFNHAPSGDREDDR